MDHFACFACARFRSFSRSHQKNRQRNSNCRSAPWFENPTSFVAYGDTRFHDPADTGPANPAVRVALEQAIAAADPNFICFTGDIVYNGYGANDWKVWDNKTSTWRENGIPVYPALGNHDLHGKQDIALANYFQRFPDLNHSRYYSLRAANMLTFVLDSSLDKASGPQGAWPASKLDQVPPDVDFVFVMLHHPPYTGSSDAKMFGGGHSSRPQEHQLAKVLERRQTQAHFRILVFSGRTRIPSTARPTIPFRARKSTITICSLRWTISS